MATHLLALIFCYICRQYQLDPILWGTHFVNTVFFISSGQIDFRDGIKVKADLSAYYPLSNCYENRMHACNLLSLQTRITENKEHHMPRNFPRPCSSDVSVPGSIMTLHVIIE